MHERRWTDMDGRNWRIRRISRLELETRVHEATRPRGRGARILHARLEDGRPLNALSGRELQTLLREALRRGSR